MSLKFPPKPGLIVICDYTTGFREPEMVKERLAVVVSPRLPYRDGLCTVVPLSTTPARSGIRYQCRVELPVVAPPPYEGKIKWAKCDMLATLSYSRMKLPYTGRDKTTGKRKYLQIVLSAEELSRVRTSMLYALGLESLTKEG
ncbi:type II toxin-antitoxin system PemK/MazF family toxin [Paenirhodobacter sp.]|uniref:type II toxin-antitoxin system PemK/MazF family toxin n=1 Tax=Paenirhodobacter sp. TaxID=1965326 RepID=UPI003B50B959